jgi:hypothetical protein
MKARLTALLLATSAALGVIAFLAPNPAPERIVTPENPHMPPQVNVTYHARTNNTTDVLRFELQAANEHLTARVFIEDPSDTPAKTLRVVNLTANDARDVQLRTLPALFRVRGVIEQPGASVLTKWVWQGHAHVIIANTPNDLAKALEVNA